VFKFTNDLDNIIIYFCKKVDLFFFSNVTIILQSQFYSFFSLPENSLTKQQFVIKRGIFRDTLNKIFWAISNIFKFLAILEQIINLTSRKLGLGRSKLNLEMSKSTFKLLFLNWIMPKNVSNFVFRKACW